MFVYNDLVVVVIDMSDKYREPTLSLYFGGSQQGFSLAGLQEVITERFHPIRHHIYPENI